MKEIFKEYGSMVISIVTTVVFLVIIGRIFLAKEGLMSMMIYLWCTGAI